MEAVVSSELDDALFPQPPQETAQDVVNEVTQQISEIETDGVVGQASQDNWEDEKSEEVCNDAVNDQDDEDDDKKSLKKKDPLKKKSRIRRLFTGIRLKKNEESATSSEDDETGSELTLDSREASATAMEEGALVNKTAFTRIIHRVQTKANRMWEQIGQKLGGRADTDDEEITEESSKSLSIMSDVKQGGDAPDNKKELGSQTSLEEVRKVQDLETKGSLPDLSAEDTSGSKGKSGTLRRIASGLKSGLTTNKQKNIN